MTVSTAPTAPPTDEKLLIREAIRLRRRQRRGLSLAGAIVLAALLLAVGFLLAIHPGVVTYTLPYSFSPDVLTPILVACGAVALLVAVSFLPPALAWSRPGTPWGHPVSGDCPACGKPALRSDEVTVWVDSTLQVRARGTVTLCETPGCPHAVGSVG